MATTLETLQTQLSETQAAISRVIQMRRGGHSDTTYEFQSLEDLQAREMYLENRIARMEQGGLGLVR